MIKKLASLLLFGYMCLSGVCSAQCVDTLVINNGERRIFGLLNRPDREAKPRPLAIVAHGFNGDHRYGRTYFEPLAQAGYQCYTLDFPCGSTHSAIDSNTVNMSLLDQKSDLLVVIDYFSRSGIASPDSIVLIGESQGGLVATMAATEAPEKVQKLILAFAAFCIPDHHNPRFDSAAAIPDTVRVWRVPLGRRYFTELRTIEPYAAMTRYTRPVLLLHGDKDQVVPLSYSQRALKTFPDAQLFVIEGAGHGFRDSQLTQAIGHMQSFLKK